MLITLISSAELLSLWLVSDTDQNKNNNTIGRLLFILLECEHVITN